MALVAAGTLWMLLNACLFVTGSWETVTVTGGDGEGFCDVVWRDDSGARHRGESECYDETVGSSFDARVTGWPMAGSPTLGETYVVMGALFGLPPLAVGTAGLVLRARRERLLATSHPGTPPAASGSPDAAASAPATAAALRDGRRLARWFHGAGAVAAGGLLLVVLLAPDPDADLREVAVTTVGTVVGVERNHLSVRFTAGGSTADRRASVGGYAEEYDEGRAVDVLYDPADPARFTVDDVPYGSDGLATAAGFALGAVVLAAISATANGRANRRARRLLRARAWAPVRVRVLPADQGSTFTTPDGAVWRSRWESWPTPNREPRTLSGWGLPDEDPADVPYDQAAWWVSDGFTAVFSPDQDAPLVLARRRPGTGGRNGD